MAKLLSSPLVSASNNIVLFAKGTKQLPRVQRQLVQFDQFIRTKTVELEKLKLPDKKKIKELANLNIASTFGSPGRLLSRLASGALDVAGFLGNMFPAKGKTGKPGRLPKGTKAPKPTVKGSTLKLGGIRAVGVVNALFAGLDFATGLQEGESVGKAAAGAGGSLAGSLLGGAIGQALIPIPGVGFVLGSMAGGFLGGYAADRVYEGGSSIKKKLSERLKKQEVKQRVASSDGNFGDIVSKFSSAVSKFEQGVASGLFGSVSPGAGSSKSKNDGGENDVHEEIKPRTDGGPAVTDVDNSEYTATGGSLPSKNDPGGKDYGQFRQYYNSGNGGNHQGEDLGVGQGTAVSIIVPGKVAAAGFGGGGEGGNILITHVDGKQTRYLHMSEINVSAGQEVKSGQVIGKTGGARGTKGAGNSSGPHLHFEYYGSTRSGPMDPWPHMDKYFRFGGNVSVKKKDGAAPGATASGTKPTAIIAAGTNDYGDPVKVKANVEKSIKDLQSKGYNVVVVPPNEKGQFAGAHKAVLQAAASSGATVEKGKYDQNDPLHLQMSEASRIKQKFAGAEILGDSNAVRIAGGSMSNVAGKRVVGAGTDDILKFAKGMGRVGPVATSQVVPAQTNVSFTELLTQVATSQVVPAQTKPLTQQVQQYPTYNQPQSSVTIMPILTGGSNQGGGGGQQQKPVFIPVGGGGGGGTIILPGPSEGQLVNSLWKAMLLTNLSAA